jgi:hypothetical protein
MAEQDYTRVYQGVVSLAAGLNLLSTILLANAPNMIHALAEYYVRVESGGPVAYGSSTMAAITDGAQLLITDSSPPLNGSPGDPIDATKQGLWATNAGDKVYIYARALSGR